MHGKCDKRGGGNVMHTMCRDVLIVFGGFRSHLPPRLLKFFVPPTFSNPPKHTQTPIQEAVRQSVLDSLPQIVEEVLLRQRKKLAHKVSWVGG